MEPDKEILLKLWNNKWSRWIMISALGWQVFSGIKEPIMLLYNEAIKPNLIYLSGAKPDPDNVSNERHSFMSGYYSYELFRQLKSGSYKNWPEVFRDDKNRLESSLSALGIPNATIVDDINPLNTIDAIEKYQRARHLIESYLDKRSKNEISAFYLGLNIALLIEETGVETPSTKTVEQYLNETNKLMKVLRSNSSHRVPTLQFEKLEIYNCCTGYSFALANSFLALKEYYGIAIK